MLLSRLNISVLYDLQFQSLSISLLLKFFDTTVTRSHLMFLSHKFVQILLDQANDPCFHQEVIQHLPGQQIWRHRDMETSHQVSLKLWSLGTTLSSSFLVLSDKLDVALHVLLASVHTSHRVSLKLRDSKKTGSLSFLVQRAMSLTFVLHFPLGRVYSVVKPAFFVSARHRSPSRARCFLPSRRLSTSLIGVLQQNVPL